MTTSHERLTQAAALLRERASAVPQGPWTSWVEGRDGFGGDDVVLTDSGDLYARCEGATTSAVHDFIATMDPVVALVMAELFEAEVSLGVALEQHDKTFGTESFPQSVNAYALALANAVLGRDDE